MPPRLFQAPRPFRVLRTRPTMEGDAARPSPRSKTASLSFPQRGYCRRSWSTRSRSSGPQVSRRRRLGRGERPSRLVRSAGSYRRAQR